MVNIMNYFRNFQKIFFQEQKRMPEKNQILSQKIKKTTVIFLFQAQVINVSENIMNLSNLIKESDIINNEKIQRQMNKFRYIYKEFIPKNLQDIVPFEEMIIRLPKEYQEIMFSNFMA